ncbi:MAG TPA: 3D domain-containing protein, partial [Dehalococcoidia bacterium]|nr:3D domain-containing protein [Dehalococcoidia bacterium]
TRVVEGHDGVHYRQYRVEYENGVEVSRELVADWYDPEPQNTVIYYAPRPAAPALPEAAAGGLGGPPPDGARVVRTLRVYATWYNAASAGRSPSDPLYGITATGVRVTYGVIAVDPNVIPLGTKMYVPGYGYGVAADTGGAVVGHVIDLGYPDGVTPGFTPGWVDIYILAD